MEMLLYMRIRIVRFLCSTIIYTICFAVTQFNDMKKHNKRMFNVQFSENGSNYIN